MAQDAAIEVVKLYKRFGSTWALKEISFSIGSGLTVLLGPNGSGKSTLLSILSGLLKPTSGSAYVFGMNTVSERSKIAKIISYSPDPPSLPSFRRVHELISLVIDAGLVDEDQLYYAIRELGLSQHLSKRVYGLSAGLRKKLSIVFAYAKRNAKLVLLDEPFASLDAKSITKAIGLIKSLLEKGISVVLATHIVPSQLPKPNYLVILSEGRLIAAGESTEIASLFNTLKVRLRVSPKEIMSFPAKWGKIVVEEGSVTIAGLDLGKARELASKYKGDIMVDIEETLKKAIGI